MQSQSNFVNAARQHDTTTANGAVTHSTTLHSVLDLFFIAGASRNMSSQDILSMWSSAYVEDKQLAMRCLFRARDVRGGAGERRFFRIIWNNLNDLDQLEYAHFVSEYGRYDDLFESNSDYIVGLFDDYMRKLPVDNLGLLCKWVPRKGKIFDTVRKALKLSPKQLRRILVDGTRVVEQQMSAKEWSAIEYNKIPSQAFQKYKKAFMRNDEARFTEFINTKSEQIKSGTLFPYQLYQSYKRGEDEKIINEQWNNLPDYVGDGKSFLPMVDVSGSMECSYGKNNLTPMDISVSLGVYLSERNKSIFKNAFITFTSQPKMQYLSGTACQRFEQIQGPVGYDTNLQKAFKLVLDTAIRNNLNNEDLPENILVISDMEFNQAGGLTNHEAIKLQYSQAGYKMPNLVYWNVNGRQGNTPVNMNEQGVALVSGASPAIIKGLLGGEDFSPMGIMLKTLNSERYLPIK